MKIDVPCCVGDVVWGITREFGRRNAKKGPVQEIYFADKSMVPAISVRHVCTGFWGKDVFATEQEALAEIKRQKEEV